jgi:cell division transport system ATP-binding protein
MIEFKKVTKTYPPDIFALKDVSFKIKSREFVSIVGPSGAGKTTLAKLIIKEEEPSCGEIIIGGNEINNLKKRQIPYLRRRIGMVFQDFKLLPKKSAFENVAFAMEVSGKTSKEIKRIVPRILKLVGLLDKKDSFPDQLSGGEKQRVAIARAMVHQPKILIADEPTGNIDPKTAFEIIDLLLRINQAGTTVVLATHNKDIVDRLKKRVISLHKGKIISDKKVGKYKI